MTTPKIRAGAGISFVETGDGSMLSLDPRVANIFRQAVPVVQSEPLQYNIDFNLSVQVVGEENILVVSEGNIQGLNTPAINVFRRTPGQSFFTLENGTSGIVYLEMPVVPASRFDETSKSGLLTTPLSQYINTIRIESDWSYPLLDSAAFKAAPVFPLPEDGFLYMRVAEYSVTEDGVISYQLLRFGTITIPHAIFQPGYGVSTSFRAA